MTKCTWAPYQWFLLLLLGLLLNVADITGDIVTYSAYSIVPILTEASISHSLCLARCGKMEACFAFNYLGTEGRCEWLGAVSLSATVAAPGWTCHRMIIHPPADYKTDACLSSPCPPGTVCVSYVSPSRIPFGPERTNNYTLKGYTCSVNTWLLAREAEGKTSCQFVEVQDSYSYNYYNLMATMPYYDAFAACREVNCLSLFCIFMDGEIEECYLMSQSYLTNARVFIPYTNIVYWYAHCI